MYFIMLAVTMGLYLMLPFISSEERRQRWCLRMKLCQWHVDHLMDVRTAETGLSHEEEDSIRNSYLTQNLEQFTLTLKPEMIIQSCDATDLDPQKEQLSSNETIVNKQEGANEASIGGTEEPKQATEVSSLPKEEGYDDDAKGGDIETGISQKAGICETDIRDAKYTLDAKEFKEQGEDESVLSDEDADGLLYGLPLAGDCRHNDLSMSEHSDAAAAAVNTRQVANSCSICLSVFQADERLCWSSNPECQHIYHHNCIQDWLQAIGRKQLTKVRRDTSTEHLSRRRLRERLLEKMTDFPMSCPCCRQVFVVVVQNDENETNVEKGNIISDIMDELGHDSGEVPSLGSDPIETPTSAPVETVA